MNRVLSLAGLLAACLSVPLEAVKAGEAFCTPGELRTDSTPMCISIEWDLTGDTDHDATCGVRFREEGTAEWKDALPLFRVDYQWWYNTEKADKPFNMFAGSIMFLKPGSKYEVSLDMADPDGGTATQTVSVATRPVPEPPKGGRTFHVVPGAGGGAGSAEAPFPGLTAAQDAAEPGDILLLHKGDYGSFNFEKSGTAGQYLVCKAAGDGDVVFTSVRINASHLWLEGLTLKRQDEPDGLRAQGQATDVVICRNTFTGFHYSITLSTESRNWCITDNVIVGDNDPNQPTTQGGISGEGVELNHSGGHVVACNSISRVADGVSYPERNVDIYGNDIFDVSDDGLEPDRGYANVRMWGNRITNAKNNALSFQPMRCGPWYFVRNLVIGQGAIFKFRVQDRFVLVNNTFVRWGATGSRMHHILSSLSRNNLYISAGGEEPIWIGGDCTQPQFCLPNNYEPTWMTDVDYDGFDWGDYREGFRWNNRRRRFTDVEEFAAAVGIERHGIRVRKEDTFDNWSIPAEPARVPPQHLPLTAAGTAVDAGAVVPNLSENFKGKAPDLGAYEFGDVMPDFGPRKK